MLFVDAHVHIYDCHDPATLFDAALNNFRRQAIRLGTPGKFTGVLLLTEAEGHHWFARLLESGAGKTAADLQLGDWRVTHTAEKDSLILVNPNNDQLVVIAGRQLVSSEGLEILALVTAEQFDGGRPAAQLVGKVADSGAVPVIPWAFGKWFGARGKVLKQLMRTSEMPDFYLGDNGGRPSFFPYPVLLRSAGKKGEKILSGSDPLPLKGDERRVGSFGIYAEAELHETEPAACLRALIRDKKVVFHQYGTEMKLIRFVRNQLELRGM